MLEIKDLYVNYGAVHALNGVSMTMKGKFMGCSAETALEKQRPCAR